MDIQSMIQRWRNSAPHLRSLLRIMSAIVFIQSGTMKLFAWPIGLPPGVPPIEPFSEIWFAGMLEVVGGALMLIGYFTRPVAFVLAGEMAVAYFQAHAGKGFWTLVNGGADAVLFCFIWLYFSAAGAGEWSLDARSENRK